jgi:two-component system response regulator YesN
MIEAILVDDEILALRMLKELVDWKRLGINICATAMDGEEAFEAFIRFKPNLIITDICMPRTSGLDFIEKVAKIDSETEFILISAHADFKYVQQALRLGCADYVLKPVDEWELETVIRKATARINTKKVLAAQKEREETRKKKKALIDYIKTGRDTISFSSIIGDKVFDSFCLMSIEFICEESRQYEKVYQRIYTQKSYVEHMLESIFKDFGEFVLFDHEDDYWLALLWECEILGLTARADRIAAFVRNELECKPAICFSEIRTGIESLPELYRRLSLLREYSLFMRTEDVHGYGYNCVANEYVEFSSMEAKMSEAIRNYNNDSALRILDEMLDRATRIDPSLLSNVYEFCHKTILLTRAQVETGGLRRTSSLDFTYEQLKSTATLEDLRGKVADALSAIEKTGRTEPSTEILGNIDIVQQGEELIRKRYNTNISLDDLCHDLAISKNYFCCLFKKKTGKTVMGYVMETRMENAKILLRESDLKSSEIAYKVGYDNPSYFSKIFKRLYQMTPNGYRTTSANAERS